jgi:MSHA biogenesis protein MshN
MSVINQMLQDLDKRNPDHSKSIAPTNQATNHHSPIKIVLITAVLVSVLCLTGFYIWHLLNENSALRAEHSAKLSGMPSNTSAKTAPVFNHDEPLQKTDNLPANTVEKTASIVTKVSPKVEERPEQSINKTSNKSASVQVADDSINVSDSQARPLPITTKINAPVSKAPPIANKNMREMQTENRQSSPTQLAIKSTPPKMSVSRRQLSASELSQQKLDLAEKALAAKQVSKAEKLLEDVVIITPNDSQARKKLAALWFGRQAYQDAVNLLSQGIALDSKDSSLREMKARIYLKQGQVNAALNTLKPLAKLKDEQYQIMLANTAQQAQQHDIAIAAYQQLISMKPDAGRWYLGLAVLYDKNSQFTLASNAYKQALTKSDLSISSETFAKQRIQVIGQ